MKAFGTATLCFSLLVVAACGEEYIEAPRVFPLPASADASQLHAQLCRTHARALFLAEGSVIRWRAIKNGTTPVEGTQNLTGHLVSESTTRMQGLTIHLDFDVASVDSADELRDTRIMNYVLGLAEGLPMNFDLTSASGEGQDFPGTSGATMDLAGALNVASKKSSVATKVGVSKAPNGYRISTGTTPVSLNLKTDLGLTVEVERLMALVDDVTLDDTITISFDLLFEDGCA